MDDFNAQPDRLLDHVAKRIFEMSVNLLLPHGSEVVVVVDDTLNKHCGKKICGSSGRIEHVEFQLVSYCRQKECQS